MIFHNLKYVNQFFRKKRAKYESVAFS